MVNRNYVIYSVIQFFLPLIICCNSTHNQNIIKSNQKAISNNVLPNNNINSKCINDKSDTCSLADTFQYKSYKIVVETKYITDSLINSPLLFNTNIFYQAITFYRYNLILNQFYFNPHRIEVESFKHEKYKVFENVLYEAAIIKGYKKWLYKISGGGITGNQTEYCCLFTSEGVLVWYNYSSARNPEMKENPSETKGNIDSIFNIYRIDLKKFNHPDTTIYIGR